MAKNNVSEISDERLSYLLSRIEKKDQTAFNEIHRVYLARISTFVRPKLYGQDDVIESIANHVLLEIWRKPTAFNGKSLFSTFLLAIAKNKLLQHWDKQDKALLNAIDSDDSEEDPLDAIPSDAPLPEIQLLDKEKLNVLDDCKDKHLKGFQLAVFNYIYLFGYSLEHVAQILDRNSVTTRRAFKIALEKVRDCVGNRLKIKRNAEGS
jgi:RNA polymerase sigma-70 factor (ECF subfamily)